MRSARGCWITIAGRRAFMSGALAHWLSCWVWAWLFRRRPSRTSMGRRGRRGRAIPPSRCRSVPLGRAAPLRPLFGPNRVADKRPRLAAPEATRRGLHLRRRRRPPPSPRSHEYCAQRSGLLPPDQRRFPRPPPSSEVRRRTCRHCTAVLDTLGDAPGVRVRRRWQRGRPSSSVVTSGERTRRSVEQSSNLRARPWIPSVLQLLSKQLAHSPQHYLRT